MSNKSGIAEQVITLPKGGGELKGMGETFSPDLHTGTGNSSVPIALPSGRNGFQPQISLVYSTGNGNSPFGLGWQLSIPGVSRKTTKGIPQYQGKDTFLLSSAEDLIPVQQGQGYVRYKPRTEGLFALIHRFRSEEEDYWEVKTKDGLISRYGHPHEPGQAAIFNPNNPDHIFSWKLSETQDPFGNRIVYEYKRDLQETNIRHFNQLYLASIKYLDYRGENDQEQFLVKVDFEYDEERPDPFSVYTSGFEIRTRKRCRRIVVRTFPNQQETLVRTYEMTYRQGENNLVSLLSEIQVVGHHGEQEERLPPLTFDYTPFQPKGKDFRPIQGRELPVNSLANPDTEMVDLFGNGLPDIVQMNGVVRYWKNLGNGRYDMPRIMKEAPAGISIASPNVQFMDANGEGKADLVVTNNGLSGYFPTNFKGGWDRQSFRKYKSAPPFNFADPISRLIDLNGDGVVDLLRTHNRLECYFNDPHKGWHDILLVARQALENFPNVNFSDPRIHLADMTGDSLQDIVMISSGHVQYWPYMGYGKWGKRISMRNSPRLPKEYDSKRILIGDIAGDGPHDFLYIDHRKMYIWVNQNGNGFSEPIIINGTPPVNNMDSVRLLDLNGTGTSGILWSADQRINGRDHLFYLDLTLGVKPFVLNEMNNNMGAITRVEYRSSTYYYLQDEKNPETRWKTHIPFPVQVVACVEVIDEISRNKLTTEYSYHHGHWDGAEREFRGFGRVEQRDTQTFENYSTEGLHGSASFQEVEEKFYSPPTLSKTWFHQGPVGEEHGDWTTSNFRNEFWSGDAQKFNQAKGLNNLLKHLPRRAQRDGYRSLRGSVLRTELYALDGDERESRPYSVSESYYVLRKVLEPEDTPFTEIPKGTSGYVFLPLMTIKRSTQWERGDDPMTQFNFSQSFDAYGHPREQIAIACPRGWGSMTDQFSEENPYLGTYTKTELAYSYTSSPYIKGKTAKTTTYEILPEGEDSIWGFKFAIRDEDRIKLIAQSLAYYDGEAFEGLPYKRIGQFGVAVRSESLVIDEAILQEAWTDENGNVGIPTYIDPANNGAWPAEYPTGFQDTMPELAGYTFHDGSGEQARGYWVQGSSKYDFQEEGFLYSKGLPLEQQDPMGRVSYIEYDSYHFLPIRATDPLGLEMRAENDYRLFQPYLSIDPNDNVSLVRFSPQGFVTSSFQLGKEGVEEGDGLDRNDPDAIPSARNEYDFFAFTNAGMPIYSRTIAREHHVFETDVPEEERDATIETIEFSDGFGRLIQTRTQAEDVLFGDSLFGNELLPETQGDPAATSPRIGNIRQANDPINVIVSGWQIYDNKGQVVQKYEPFYAKGFQYADLSESVIGQKVEQFYDPLGRLIRTLNPDGSEQRVIFGIPNQLDIPEQYISTPWEAYTYDANDLAPLTGHEDRVAENHWYTPASIEVDALGRTITAVARNGRTIEDELITRSTYDIRGNLLTVIDPLGRIAFRYTYDLTSGENGSQVWRINSIDAGLRRMVINALGQEIERRDNKGCIGLNAFDEGDRPILTWARDKVNLSMTLRQKLIYGDTLSLSEESVTQLNLLGQINKHFDEAGLVTIVGYDFKGNPLHTSRRVIRDEVVLQLVGGSSLQHFQVDWTDNQDPEELLETKIYKSNTLYDALNRPKQVTYPEDVEGERKTLIPAYSRAGALESIALLSVTEENSPLVGVTHIAYNARGQRTLIAYTNGLMTRYTYDDQRFWLNRLRTEKYDQQAANNYEFIPAGGLLQDLGYEYDLIGNILIIKDRSPGAGLPNSPQGQEALDRHFGYDPIYRLISATGREHTSRDPRPDESWAQAMVHTNQDVTATRAYTRQYQYDAAGNMLERQHFAPSGMGNFTRSFTTKVANNQLADYQQGGITHQLTYDPNGNMVAEGLSRHYHWNHRDQLHAFRIQANEASAPSLEARYLYDAGGQRVKKIVWHQGGRITTTTYIGGAFEYHTESQAGEWKENNSLHVMDDQSRIALLRIGEAFDPNDTSPAIQYQLGGNLGSAQVIADEYGNLHSREEHYPYGGTSFGSFSRKRYRFTGKERDEESGLNYHGARYYAMWQGKWVSADPLGMVDGLNLFQYVSNNPINLFDPEGTEGNWGHQLNEGLYNRRRFKSTKSLHLAKGTTTTKVKYYKKSGITEVSTESGDLAPERHDDRVTSSWTYSLGHSANEFAVGTWEGVKGSAEFVGETTAMVSLYVTGDEYERDIVKEDAEAKLYAIVKAGKEVYDDPIGSLKKLKNPRKLGMFVGGALSGVAPTKLLKGSTRKAGKEIGQTLNCCELANVKGAGVGKHKPGFKASRDRLKKIEEARRNRGPQKLNRAQVKQAKAYPSRPQRGGADIQNVKHMEQAIQEFLDHGMELLSNLDNLKKGK